MGGAQLEHREGLLDGLEVTGSRVPVDAPVAVDVELRQAEPTIVVTGTVRGRWAGACRRCLGDAAGELVVDLREVYESGSDGEETYRLDGDRLDLEPLARDAMFSGLPAAPLCAQECLGLCPTCGANRNEGPCGCTLHTTDARWAALDALRAGPRQP